MKKIANINLSEQSPENKEPVSSSTPRRQPPSGSGSGEGNNEPYQPISYFGSSSQVISLSENYSWEADCTFNWNADITFKTVNGIRMVEVLRVYVTNIQLILRPICKGVQSGGIYYRPSYYCHLFSPISRSLFPDDNCNEINARETTTLQNKAFSVLEITYDIYGGEEQSETFTIYKSIVLEFTFSFNKLTGEPIQSISCDISLS